VWDPSKFEAFKAYTLAPEHRVAPGVVKGTELEVLLRDFTRGPGRIVGGKREGEVGFR